MDNRILGQLVNLGLQKNEAIVYIALLELGKGTVSEISKTAHLNRTTGYDILERICLYGIANRSTVGKKRIYIAEPPSRLRNLLAARKHKAEKDLEKIDDVLPDLQSLYKTDLKPSIKFFEGFDGIKNIYHHSLEARETIYSILDLEQYLPELDDFGREHIKERTRLKIREKVLARKSAKAVNFYVSVYTHDQARQRLTEYRWLEHEFAFSPAAEVMIYDDKVIGVLFKPGEKSAFEIQSQSFANSLKILFEIAWHQSKPI